MVAGVFVFADHMLPRPARFNSRFNLLGQSSFLSWPIWSVNAIPKSLFWCSGSQNFSQYLMALHFVFVHTEKRPTSGLHAFELRNLLTPNSHLMNFVCTNSIGSFSSQVQCNLFDRGHHQDQRKRPLNERCKWDSSFCESLNYQRFRGQSNFISAKVSSE